MMDLVLKEYLITISKLFFSKYVTPKKILNAVAVYLQYLLKTERIIGYPIKIYVDPTSVCNLKCPLCPTGKGDKSRSKGFMKFEAFKKIIDEVKDYVIQVDLYNWGEPLLNKEIFKMVEYAHKLGIRTRISTNLTILSESAAENMINSGLDELIVSIDGASEETYQKYRVGGSFEKVIENLKLILRKKEEMKKKNPEVVWQFLIMRHNEHEIEKAKQMAKELKVRIRLLPARADMGEEIFLSDEEKKIKYSNWLSDKFSKYRRKFFKKSCAFLYTQLIVNWNGSVSSCCGVYPEKYDFGNVFLEGGAIKVWNNQMFRRARSIVRRREIVPDIICSNCIKNGFLEP